MDGLTSVVVVAGGEPPPPSVVPMLPPGATVIAADSGLDHAAALGLEPSRVVGDMDSVSSAGLASLGDDVRVELHPVDKDASDLELAVRAALDLEPDEIVVVGGHGGRLDHLLANVALLASDDLADVAVRWLAGRDLVIPVRDHVTVQGRARALVSIIPIGGPALGVTTTGLRWELDEADLDPTSSRTVSNQFLGTEATVTVSSGVVVVIIPDAI
jgi:thiamine pyrophosphokinase